MLRSKAHLPVTSSNANSNETNNRFGSAHKVQLKAFKASSVHRNRLPCTDELIEYAKRFEATEAEQIDTWARKHQLSLSSSLSLPLSLL
jgi:hypothetical protein